MRIYCEHCGHSITVYKKINFLICSHCGHRVYTTEKRKFKTIIFEKLNEIKRMEKANEQSNFIRQSM